MSESIAEMVIPGTYIEVRAEGPDRRRQHRHGQHRHRRHRGARPGRHRRAARQRSPRRSTSSAGRRVRDARVDGGTPLTPDARARAGLRRRRPQRLRRPRSPTATRRPRTRRAGDRRDQRGFTLTGASSAGTCGQRRSTYIVVDQGDRRRRRALTGSSLTYGAAARGVTRATTSARSTTRARRPSTLVTVGDGGERRAGFDPVATHDRVDRRRPIGAERQRERRRRRARRARDRADQHPARRRARRRRRPAASLGAHLEPTENEGRERIAILGAEPRHADVATGRGRRRAPSRDDRIVLVAPGLVADGRADRRRS